MGILIAFITGCALCVVACAYCLWRASQAVDNCNHSEARLLQQRGRIVGLETALENLESKYRKLNGRVSYNEKRREPEDDEETETPVAANGAAACENYTIAQREGPTSRAAQCECDYCNNRRGARIAARANAGNNGRGALGSINDGE